jgi:Methyltransferase domain
MTLLRDLADPASNPYRARRLALFASLLCRLPTPVRILDVGGSERSWERGGLADRPDLSFVILNVRRVPVTRPNFTSVLGDARDLSRFRDRAFDVAFSNAVLEHVGGLEDQRRMAAEIRRVAGAYFVQVPNRRFPVEPHVVFPMFQYLPVPARAFLLRRLPLGNLEGRIRDREEAVRYVRSIRLVTRREMAAMFPDASLVRERVGGLTKSFIAVAGFPGGPAGRDAPGGRAGAGPGRTGRPVAGAADRVGPSSAGPVRGYGGGRRTGGAG